MKAPTSSPYPHINSICVVTEFGEVRAPFGSIVLVPEQVAACLHDCGFTEAYQYFPRAAAVKATQLTADKSTFVLDFNHGRTGYPWAVHNSQGIVIVLGPGIATEMQVGDWVVEGANGADVHDDADFCEKFCPS